MSTAVGHRTQGRMCCLTNVNRTLIIFIFRKGVGDFLGQNKISSLEKTKDGFTMKGMGQS